MKVENTTVPFWAWGEGSSRDGSGLLYGR